jgi:hypothetical protein
MMQGFGFGVTICTFMVILGNLRKTYCEVNLAICLKNKLFFKVITVDTLLRMLEVQREVGVQPPARGGNSAPTTLSYPRF